MPCHPRASLPRSESSRCLFLSYPRRLYIFLFIKYFVYAHVTRVYNPSYYVRHVRHAIYILFIFTLSIVSL
nr:MAG TPA: hypothetical protein [Caudoviricetes sp.]